MKKNILVISFIILSVFGYTQPNCNAYLWKGDTLQYKACKYYFENNRYYQFSREFHKVVDSTLAICPYFAYAYREKSASYVKSGNFIEWKKYMDLAVKYDTISYLPVRASLKYKFFADYKGTIKDIEILESHTNNIGYTSNGTYHLQTVKALCYYKLNEFEKAISTMQKYMKSSYYHPMIYDNLHMGMFYLKINDYNSALKYLLAAKKIYDFAEVEYYLAYTYKALHCKKKYLLSKKNALKLYNNKTYRMYDPYNFMIGQISKNDILKL